MKSQLMISLFSAVIASLAFAQAEVSKDVAIEVVTTVGPKQTYSVLKKQPDGSATFEMTGAEPEPIVRKLTSKDFEFIVKKIKELPVVEKLPTGCLRFQMKITTQGLGEKFAMRQGCIGQKTNTSAKFEDFTKVLEAATL